MSKMTFKEFQATRVAKTWNQARCQSYGFDEDSMDVYEYADGCFIERRPNDMYYLCIGNMDWFDPRLEMLEGLLYDRWYC